MYTYDFEIWISTYTKDMRVHVCIYIYIWGLAINHLLCSVERFLGHHFAYFWVQVQSMCTGPKDHINTRISHSGSKAQYEGAVFVGSLCLCGLLGT